MVVVGYQLCHCYLVTYTHNNQQMQYIESHPTHVACQKHSRNSELTRYQFCSGAPGRGTAPNMFKGCHTDGINELAGGQNGYIVDPSKGVGGGGVLDLLEVSHADGVPELAGGQDGCIVHQARKHGAAEAGGLEGQLGVVDVVRVRAVPQVHLSSTCTHFLYVDLQRR